MMLKRTLYSLLLVSFIAAFASMSNAQDGVTVSDELLLKKCVTWEADITVNVDQGAGDISAFEIVLDVSKVSGDCADVIEGVTVVWDDDFLATGLLPDKEDADPLDYPMIRIAAMTLGDPAQYLGPGSHVVAQIQFTTDECCAAEALIDGAQIDPGEPFGLVQTQFVDAATGGLRLAPVESGTITVANVAPIFTNVAIDETIDFGDTYTYTFAATDGDASCETQTFFATSDVPVPGSPLPAGMTLTSAGVLTFATTLDNICFDGNIVVGVRDKCQAVDMNTETVHFCVTNTPPNFTDKAALENTIVYGDVFTFDFNAYDPDPGPYGPNFSVTDGPGSINSSGEYTWNTGLVDPFGGVFSVTVKVDDGALECDPCAPINSEEYTFEITVYLVQVQIAKEEDVFIGQPHDVAITFSDISFFDTEIGGFDFLIQYDASAMMFTSATEGSFLTGCAWEYFTYRFGPSGNCGPSACPSGVLRVVAMGETNGGDLGDHPDCWQPTAGSELVVLHFLVSSDANLECQFAPIRFIWYDCGDNGISSHFGDIFYVSQYVWDYTGEEPGMDITGMDTEFPTLTGVVDMYGELIADCELSLVRKGDPWPLIHFRNGGLDIICADLIDAVGDINMNAIPYEIADAVMFTNYFIEGISAFADCTGLMGDDLVACQTHQFGAIAASDTNKDGITLSVADLVYLIRVVVGDALPYYKVGSIAMNWTHDGGVVATDGQVGGAALMVDGNVTPQLLVSGMTMDYRFDGQVTRIVVVPDVNAGAMNSFNGAFLGGIDNEIVSIEMATPEGQPIAAKNIPTAYELSQNYPNPFNPSTKISVSLRNAGDYSLTIFNVQGQVVQVMSGSVAGPERLELTWDASNLASGVYFYKLTAGNFTDTKKAVFLK
jgi:hypothetical protein